MNTLGLLQNKWSPSWNHEYFGLFQSTWNPNFARDPEYSRFHEQTKNEFIAYIKILS